MTWVTLRRPKNRKEWDDAKMPKGYYKDGTPLKPPPGGSRKGKPNKITADMRRLIEDALDKAGERLQKKYKTYAGLDPRVAYLLHQAEKQPAVFLQLIARLMPAKVDISVTAVTDELVQLMQERRQHAIEAQRRLIEAEAA